MAAAPTQRNPGKGGGTSGGVDVFVRDGTAGSTSAGTIWPARALAVEVDFGGPTPILVVSLYLFTGGRLTDDNLEILAAVGASVTTRGLPYIIAGDFNVDPAVLTASTFAQQLG